MNSTKLWLILGVLIVVLTLAFSTRASEIGTYGSTATEPTGDGSPTCGAWAGRSYTDISGAHSDSNEEYERATSAQQILGSKGNSTNAGQFCGPGTTTISAFYTLKKNGKLLDDNTWTTLSSKGNYNDGSFFKPGDPMDKLYWTWQCCIGSNCITCGARRIAPTCGFTKGVCWNGENFGAVTQTPPNSGIYTWQCRSYDTYYNPDGIDNPLTETDERYEYQYLNCGVNTVSGGGCGTMNGKSLPEAEIMRWSEWTYSPCPEGSKMVYGAIQMDWIDDPNAT
ncbi:MAG: hypothetical protein V1765_03365 [bacterium]